MTRRNDTLPDWFIVLAEQLAQFRETHGRLPVQCDAQDPGERRLGDFLRVNRRAVTLYLRGDREGSVVARVAQLDLVVPGWRAEGARSERARTPNTPFISRVNALKRFVRKQGHFPTGAGGALERSLWRFLINVRQASKGRGTVLWDQTRQEMLDREVPGWNRPNGTYPQLLAA